MRIEEGVELRRLTTIGTGGPARAFARPETVEELQELLRWADERELPVAPVGLGSNLLAADEGFEGLVLKLAGDLAKVERADSRRLFAGGGAPLAVCLHSAREAELGGLEFACAIPGTAGGGVWMNAGAYGGEIAGVMASALLVDAQSARWLVPSQLGMDYRRSNLRPGQIVATVEFHLTPRPRDEIKQIVAGMQEQRKDAQPTNKRTFGSVFKNPEHELSAGRMLEACGLRGHRIGGAQISPRHANFIENADAALTADALALMVEARRRARDQFGVELEHEVQLLGVAFPGTTPPPAAKRCTWRKRLGYPRGWTPAWSSSRSLRPDGGRSPPHHTEWPRHGDHAHRGRACRRRLSPRPGELPLRRRSHRRTRSSGLGRRPGTGSARAVQRVEPGHAGRSRRRAAAGRASGGGRGALRPRFSAHAPRLRYPRAGSRSPPQGS